MSFTTPRTWSTALVTPADLNEQLRDNMLAVQRAIFTKSAASITEVVNTTTSTDVLGYNVPANTLGTDKAIRLTAWFDYLNNTGATRALTMGVIYGGNTVAGGSVSIPAGGNRSAQQLVSLIMAGGSTGVQRCWSEWSWGETGAANAAGGFALAPTYRAMCSQILGVDSTAVQGLQLTVQHGLASVSLSIRLLGATVELISI